MRGKDLIILNSEKRSEITIIFKWIYGYFHSSHSQFFSLAATGCCFRFCRCWCSCEKCNGRGGGKNLKNCCGAQNGSDPMGPCHNTLVKALKAWYIFNCWSSSESHSREKKAKNERSSREFISERTKTKMMMKILRFANNLCVVLDEKNGEKEITTNVDNKKKSWRDRWEFIDHSTVWGEPRGRSRMNEWIINALAVESWHQAMIPAPREVGLLVRN